MKKIGLLVSLFLLSMMLVDGCGKVASDSTTSSSSTSSSSTSSSTTTSSTTPVNPWTVSVVGSIGAPGSVYTPGFTSLAVDASGKPHVGYLYYYDGSNTVVKYATMTVSSWSLEVVDPDPGASGGCLKLDAGGNPCLAYNGPDTGIHVWGDVRFTAKSGPTWTINYVDYDSSPVFGWIPNGKTPLAFNSGGTAYVAYSTSNDELKLASGSGAVWSPSVVDSSGYIGEASIALDSDSHPHISYYDGSSLVKYAEWTGAAWTIRTVGNGMQNSIAVDSAGRAHICYNDDLDNLAYAKWNGAAWEAQTLKTALTTYGNSIVLDSSDRPHIAYVHNGINDGANYVYWNGTIWVYETVQGNLNIDGISIALDPASGKPRISYYDWSNKQVKYAARN